MRTRSQAVSPSGFLSLDDVPRQKKVAVKTSTSSKDGTSKVKKPAAAKRSRKKKLAPKKASQTQDKSPETEDIQTQIESGASIATPQKKDEPTKSETQPSVYPSGWNTQETANPWTPSPSICTAAANLYNAAVDAINSPTASPALSQQQQSSPGLPSAQSTPTPPQHPICCPCCSAPLQCPNEHSFASYLDPYSAWFLNHLLTQRVANGPNGLKFATKRPFGELSSDEEDDRSDIVTPLAKRRMTGPPGSTPFARRTTPIRRYTGNMKSFSEQRRRRALERDGRITATLFRLPQLIAQQAQQAANRAAEQSDPFINEPSMTIDGHQLATSFESTESEVAEPASATESELPAEPQTPRSPRSPWGIRSLFGSVPRSLTRFFPTLGSPAESETPSVAEDTDHSPTPSAETRDRAADEKEAARDLSYSLFPAGINKRLYLGDASANPQKETEAAPAIQKPTEKDGTVMAPPGADKAGKKRKRRLSPDVIPNPVGSSYGLDLDFFTYSSPSTEGSETAVPTPAFQTPATRPLKRVRFDTSPQDTPSKLRARTQAQEQARATDPYGGRQFVGLSDPFAPRAEGPPSMPQPPVGPAEAERTVESVVEPETPSESALPAPTPDNQALAKVRSQAEKYKPKTPSSLRASSRYSASPLPSPMEPTTTAKSATSAKPAPIPAPIAEPAIVPEPTTPPSAEEENREMRELFGADDEFARDAYELYRSCPDGDLRNLTWPEPRSLAEDFGVSQEAVDIAAELIKSRTKEEVEEDYAAFCESYEEFKKTLEVGDD